MNGKPNISSQERQEIRRGACERDFECPLVGSPKTNQTEVGYQAFGEELRIFYGVENVLVFRGESGREGALEAEKKILGCKRVAV
jgi:hypothetical protein